MKNHMANIKGLAGAGKRLYTPCPETEETVFIAGCGKSFDGDVPAQMGRNLVPITTKQSMLPGIITEHGIGLENVRDVAERYFGGVNIKVKGDVFHVTVMQQLLNEKIAKAEQERSRLAKEWMGDRQMAAA